MHIFVLYYDLFLDSLVFYAAVHSILNCSWSCSDPLCTKEQQEIISSMLFNNKKEMVATMKITDVSVYSFILKYFFSQNHLNQRSVVQL